MKILCFTVKEPRFCGSFSFFTWEQCKLGDLVVITKGQQINKSKLALSGKYYVLNGGMTPSGYTDTYNTKDNTISISEGGNSCGYVNYNFEPFWSGGHNYTLLNPRINVNYLYQILKFIEPQIMALRVGSGLPNVQKSRLEELEIIYPFTTEQESIGLIFEKLDNLITLHQRKGKNEFLVKMRQIFIQKLAFAWEQCELGKIGTFTSNGVDKLSKPNELNVNLLNYMDVYNRRSISAKTCGELMQVTAKPIQVKNNNVLAGDVYFTPTSETAEDIGHVLVIEENLPNTVYSYHLMRFRPNASVFYLTYPNYGFDTAFLHKQMSIKAKGVQRFVISKPDFESLEVAFPSFEEQKKIATLLGTVDNLITLHQCKEKTHYLCMRVWVRFVNALFFNNDWEQCKLGDITNSYSGGTPTVGNHLYYGGDIPFIRSAEINSESTELFITETGLKNSSAKMVKQGDILYALYGATSGEVGRSRINGAINQAILAIIPCKDYDAEYIAQWLRKSKSSIIETYLQGGQGNLSGAIVKELEIDIPVLTEQRKLGSILYRVDNLITLHQCKSWKKIRDFVILVKIAFDRLLAHDWEQRELGKIGSTYTGLSGKSKADFGHGKGKFITYMNVFTNPIANLGTVEPIEIDDKQNTVLVGDVFFTTSSETPDEVGMSCVLTENSPNTYLNSFCFGYRPTIKVDNYYLAYMLRSASFRAKITFLAQGISRYNISKNKVMEIEIPIPEYTEQQKIGAYFRNIDNLITLHQCEYRQKIVLSGRILKSSKNENLAHDWEQCKLLDCSSEIVAGGDIDKNIIKESGKYPVIANALTDDGIVGYYDDYFRISAPAITVTGRGDVGHAKARKTNFTPVVRLLSIKTTHNEDFIENAINNLNVIVESTGVPQLTVPQLQNYVISLPLNAEEEIKIGLFLVKLNNLITLHQCKDFDFFNRKNCNLSIELRTQKTTTWEQREVRNTFKVTRGYVLAATKTSPTKSDKTPYPVYSSQTKDNGLMGYYSDYLFDSAITWTTDGANAGTVRFRDGKFYCTNVCGVLLSENGYANKMVAEALNLVAWKYVSKVGNPKLMNNVMGEIEIIIPSSMEEQSQISQLLCQIDNLITLHQRVLINFKEHFYDKRNEQKRITYRLF